MKGSNPNNCNGLESLDGMKGCVVCSVALSPLSTIFDHKCTFLMWKMILKKYTFTQRYTEKMDASIDDMNNLLI